MDQIQWSVQRGSILHSKCNGKTNDRQQSLLQWGTQWRLSGHILPDSNGKHSALSCAIIDHIYGLLMCQNWRCDWGAVEEVVELKQTAKDTAVNIHDKTDFIHKAALVLNAPEFRQIERGWKWLLWWTWRSLCLCVESWVSPSSISAPFEHPQLHLGMIFNLKLAASQS